MITIKNLKVFTTDLQKELFSISNFTIEKNDLIFISGPSGRGKSTMFKILAKQYYAYTGEIEVEKKNIKNYSDKDYFSKIQYVNQYYTLFNHMTIFEQCTDALLNRQEISFATAKETILSHFNQLSLIEHKDKKPSELSGGQKQRAAIIQKVLLNPEYLLLDEPTASLDYINKKKLFEYLCSLKEKKKTLIFATHDQDLESFFIEKKTLLI
jgi:ABC-type lipoprotein export system ATPase subunit